MTECEHDDIDTSFDMYGTPTRTCHDCGVVLDEQEPDDDWYQRSAERSAGVGEPNRDYYDGGKLVRVQ